MKRHGQFASIKFANGETMFINTKYITAYAYVKERDETVVSVLCENQEIYFPGDQTEEICSSYNGTEG